MPSPSWSVKIQNIMGGKVCLRCKGKTLLGIVNKLFIYKKMLTTIWIFDEGEGDVIKFKLPFKIFSALLQWTQSIFLF